MNSSIKFILQGEIADFISQHKYDPFTPEFVFGHSDEYTLLRNRTITSGSNPPLTMLSAMLRYGLDDLKRINLFPNVFDLGNTKKLSKEKLTLVHLAKKVREERGLADDVATRKKEFESITDSLKKITGRRFGEYEDKQNTLRVVYLLDRMMINPKYADRGRSKRLLTFIKSPVSAYSFETRSTYPVQKSESVTYFLNDLKAYLAIEINVGTLERIDVTFHSIIDDFNDVRAHLDQIAYSAGPRACVMDAYQRLHAVLEAIDIPQSSNQAQTSCRLDQDLYIQLHRIEFLHFVGEHSKILNKATPPSPIDPIREDIIAALSDASFGQRTYYDTAKDNLPLSLFAVIAEQQSAVFKTMVEKALGFHVSDTQYLRVVPLAGELLYRAKLFGEGLSFKREEIVVSFRAIVCAICAVAQDLKYPTEYRPGIYGNDNRPRSIITPLEKPLDFESGAPPEEIQEGYLQLWHNRREWVLDALEGNYDVTALKFSLRAALLNKVAQCVSFNDITLIEEAITKLRTDLLGVRPCDLSIAPPLTNPPRQGRENRK